MPVAKNYRCEKAALNYDKDHINNWRGATITILDKWAIDRSLSEIKNIITLLDVPCGTGRVLKLASKHAENIIGSDISCQMLDVAKNKKIYGAKGYVNSDIFNYSFKSNSIDVIISNRFYTHLPKESKKTALKNMAQITKRYLIIEEGIPGFIARLRWKIENILGLAKTLTPWHTSTWEYINECAKEADLKVIKIIPRLPLLLDTYLIVFEKITTNESNH